MDSDNKAKEKLINGDLLCRRKRPIMDSTLVQKVKKLYEDVRSYRSRPMIYASSLGLDGMVWGFLECAKQTNTNLETGKNGEEEALQEFLLHSNSWKQTALDVAIAEGRSDVVKVLLPYFSLINLISYRNDKGKTPLSLLRNHPEYDQVVFVTLEAATTRTAEASTFISIDGQQQPESVLYNESAMDAKSYPMSHRNTKKSLDKLDHGQLELSPNKNTILHLVSQFGDIEYVKDILEKHPSLIYYRNYEGETAAYVAAREGHVDVLDIIIKQLKKFNNSNLKLLLTRGMDKHTALHIAVQNHHAGVVFWLIKELPQLAYHINDLNESPLYLVAERRYLAILNLFLSNCKEISFEGPHQKTALHAASISRFEEGIKHLLSARENLLYAEDKHGWIPLYYAIQHNNSNVTALLLDRDPSIGLQLTTKDGITTSAIHIAASKGHCETMKVLTSKCPGCLEIMHSKGRNILHIAIENKNFELIEFIFGDESFTSLINKRDSDGNTPIHLLMASDDEMVEIAMDSRVDVNVLNNENHTPFDMLRSDENRDKVLKGIANSASTRNKKNKRDIEAEAKEYAEELKKNEKEVEKYYKIKDNIVLVAVLIATATFAAAFTVPGGYDGNKGSQQGMPILLKKSAFQAFVIFNTIAFCCSCSVLFGHIMLLIYLAEAEYNETILPTIEKKLASMYLLTGFSMFSMAIAFVTGVYVVLTTSIGLAAFLCVMSLFIMISMSVFPMKFLSCIIP